jgi:hypothetical protein
MKTGNSVPAANDRHGVRVRVRDDSQRQLRDIEELVAKLQDVTEQLQTPVRPAPHHGPHEAALGDEGS